MSQPQTDGGRRPANRPVHVIRYGTIKAAIWRNETAGGPMHNVTLVRLYKDGDDWKESSSFGPDDTLVAAKILTDAHTWIFTQGARRKEVTPA